MLHAKISRLDRLKIVFWNWRTAVNDRKRRFALARLDPSSLFYNPHNSKQKSAKRFRMYHDGAYLCAERAAQYSGNLQEVNHWEGVFRDDCKKKYFEFLGPISKEELRNLYIPVKESASDS